MGSVQEVWTLTQPKRDNVSSDPLPGGQSGLLFSSSAKEKNEGKIKDTLRARGTDGVDCRQMLSKNMARESFAHRKDLIF